MKLRAKVIFEWEYDADPEAYGTDDPAKAAENEMIWVEDGGDIFGFLDMCPNEPKILIVPIAREL